MFYFFLSCLILAQAPFLTGKVERTELQAVITPGKAEGVGVAAGRIFPPVSPGESSKKKFSESIEDNSFFIEEAYNQERRVVQHISEVYYYARPDKGLFFNFTQEWPIFGPKHQFSYTILYSRLDGVSLSGLNDLLVNYRYQLFDEDNWVAAAPRLSLILPTGNAAKGLGYGVVGIQTNLPLSKRISEYFVLHGNIGFTYQPRAKGPATSGRQVRSDLFSYTYGGSMIFLVRPDLNILLECLISHYQEFNDRGDVVPGRETILNPGLRYAINLGRLQIVPGIAIPISRLGNETRVGIFLYLSFEHPY
jgi:hypothetical protein